jgi:S1-C subfamily serine protease
LVNEIQKNSIGDQVTFAVLRDGNKLSIKLKLEASSEYND